MNDKIIILGINWEQNSSAALMIDGKIVSAISEERFSRKKNDESYPKNAIDYILKFNGIKKSDITNVCFISNYWSPTYTLTRHYTSFSINDYIKEQNEYWYKKIYKNKKISFLRLFKNKIDLNQFPGKKFWKNVLKKIQLDDHSSNKKLKSLGQEIRKSVVIKHLEINSNKIKFLDHSFGHIAYAYCSGKFYGENSYVASIDAFGDFVNYSAYHFKKNNKDKVVFNKIISGQNSIIARLYRYTTLLLNMKPNEHEYKLMGLAPYCKPKYMQSLFNEFRKLQTVQKKVFFDINLPKDSYFYFKKLYNGHRFDSIAGALQKYTEFLLTKWISNIINPKKTKKLCIAGGVAMNVKANLEISKLDSVNEIYVPPTPDDTSQSIGACYAFCLKNGIKSYPLNSAYLGYEINNKKIDKAIKRKDFKSNFSIIKKNITHSVVNMLLKNKIIGVCRGKAEFGARSLGNRSIICNPSNLDNIRKINETVKNRDFWMPFAGSVIDKYAQKYFDIDTVNKKNHKYMTNCVNTKKKNRDKIAAAIHPYDKTCRPQILFKKDNPFFYKLIYEFGKKSGTYALLNTSLNTHGYPIINNEIEAIDILKNTNLDALIIGDLLIKKKNKGFLN